MVNDALILLGSFSSEKLFTVDIKHPNYIWMKNNTGSGFQNATSLIEQEKRNFKIWPEKEQSTALIQRSLKVN